MRQELSGNMTEKGQVTIPLAVRKLLDLKPRDRVTFRITKERVELLPASMSLEKAFGAVQPRSKPEDWKEARRRAREERVRRHLDKIMPLRAGKR
jgi:AbrB family looped-hinge helix DNA binding protein